jgi:hypothetical protein
MGGRSADAASSAPALSADGRYVAFASEAVNLTPGDGNQNSDVYLYDLASESITLVSATSMHMAANADSRIPRRGLVYGFRSSTGVAAPILAILACEGASSSARNS